MSSLFTHSSCTASYRLQAGDLLTLTTPVVDEGVTLFRRTLYLKVPLDQLCCAVNLAPESRLQLNFEPVTVDVTRTNDAWVKTWTTQDDHVDIELTYPAPILRLCSHLYGKVAVHRMDGEAVSEQATVTADSGQNFSEPVTAPAFRVLLSERHSGRYMVEVADKITEKHAQGHASGTKQKVAGETLSEDQEQVRKEVLVQSALDAVVLQGQPANPRLRLLNAGGSETLWQQIEAGLHPEAVSLDFQGEAFAELLAPALKRVFEQWSDSDDEVPLPLPTFDDAVVLPLLVENDAPCRVTVAQTNLNFSLEAELVVEPVKHQFTGGRSEIRRISLELPSGTPQALTFDGSLDLPQPAWQSLPPAIGAGTGLTGISLSKGDQVGVPLKIEQPLKLSGIAVGWYGLAEDTKLKVAVSRDGGDRPAAKPLAEGTLTDTGDVPEWLHFRLDETALQPGLYWISLRLLAGSGIWLGQPVATAQHIRQESAGQAEYRQTVPLQPYLHPLTSDASATAVSDPLQIKLNGTPLTYTTASDNSISISGTLAEIPAALQTQSSWAFETVSGQLLYLTIKSIRVRYTR